ncbi:hypothetical protein IQ37_17960 [Chryseobacterium piperi]|uniref:Alpha/beta hydrolase n=1 Tax=Chryseobacterium piperi TaxID=558152 RepID=A0A086AHP7_9FLAO|nr:alpha/beta hydrolase [Chryseobacterium piperi]ASW73903.1 alpha/beta hydrolase [Chryseobacterium piperi]KFF16211.1 hypothetical protein IQ37_17960 [Chryseobacterium piperi]
MNDNTSIWKKVKNQLQRIKTSITPGKLTLIASGYGILISAVIFFIVVSADKFLPEIGLGNFILFLILSFLVSYVIGFLIGGLAGLLGKTPPNFRYAIGFVLFFFFYFILLTPTFRWILTAFIIIFPALTFGALYYWKSKSKEHWSLSQKILTALSLVTGALGLVIGGYIYLYAGQSQSVLKNYKMSGSLPAAIEASNPALPGQYKVAFLSYGSGKDQHRAIYGKDVRIKTPSVDGSILLKSWDGISGKLRTRYFGFDKTQLPLNAMVWYPENFQGQAPLVLIVHGNHLAQDWSEEGYDYLGKLLASRGYIVASVDENFLNTSFTDLDQKGFKDENGTRGWLMLKHLQLWRQWNKDPSNPFFNRINMDQIALIGHSRGGEAMSHAALFNKLPYFPDNANEIFDFNFNIKAYVAIAPVDGQYQPASILAPLEDINYFVIQGVHDMDMQSYGGLATYKRIKYSPDYQGFKAGLYVHQANHGQFNTSWGKYDSSSPYINQFNMTNLMPENEQQQIAKVYISAFLDVNLKGDMRYKPLFVDYRYGRQWLPKHIYFNQFEDSQTTFIARYEEDLNLSTATSQGVTISTENLSLWREAQQKLMWNNLISRAVYIGWNHQETTNKPGRYIFNFAENTHPDLKDHALAFNLAESDEPSVAVKRGIKKKKEEKEKAPKKDQEKKAIDFSIEITDQKGTRARFLLSECAPLQPQLKKNLTKLSFFNDNADAEAIPDFFYFDFNMLQKKYPQLDLGSLKSISFIFDKSPEGVIVLDDVSIVKLPGTR